MIAVGRRSPSFVSLRRSWVIPALIVIGLTADAAIVHLPSLSGDTVALVQGAHGIAYCLSHGIHTRCDQVPAISPLARDLIAAHQRVEGGVNPYSIFQYVPAFILIRLGMGDADIYKALSILSLVAFCVSLGLGAWVASRGRALGALAVLILTASPLLSYAGSTFGESLAAFLLVLSVVATIRRWHPALIGLCVLLACVTKETVFPVIFLLGAAALWAQRLDGRRPARRRHWWGLCAGIVAGVVINGAFNIFRYGQVTNYTYGHSWETVPGVGRRLGLSVAVWLAPNGGAVWFWTLGALVAIGLIAIGGWILVRQPARRRDAVPAVAMVIGLVFFTGTLGSWWAPFGWQAWGPRLSLSVLAAVGVAAPVIYALEFEAFLRWALRRPIGLAVVVVLVLALGLPEANILTVPGVAGQLFSSNPACPSVLADPNGYYTCLNRLAWDAHLILPETFHAFRRGRGILFGVVFALVWSWLILIVRAEVGLGLPGASRVSGRRLGLVAALTERASP
jgi:hypothetical protein